MTSSFAGRNYRYSPLVIGTREKCQPCTLAFLLKALGLLVLTTMSFLAGRLSLKADSKTILNLSTHSRIFEYVPIFGAAPSNASDTAWSSIFPEQGGFFRHPTLAPERSAFSVFHQLHCLDGIRQGYYTLHDAATTGRQINDTQMPMMSSPRHISHCIDLIRQSLMCQPDTTIEVKNESVGGVTGFGTRHSCRDWDGLMAWMGEWQSFDQEEKKKNDEENKS